MYHTRISQLGRNIPSVPHGHLPRRPPTQRSTIAYGFSSLFNVYMHIQSTGLLLALLCFPYNALRCLFPNHPYLAPTSLIVGSLLSLLVFCHISLVLSSINHSLHRSQFLRTYYPYRNSIYHIPFFLGSPTPLPSSCHSRTLRRLPEVILVYTLARLITPLYITSSHIKIVLHERITLPMLEITDASLCMQW